MSAVLDASACLAYLQREAGAQVDPIPLPEPTLLWPTLAPEAKRPRIRAPRTAEGPETSHILDRRIATRGSIRTLPLAEKVRLKFLYSMEYSVRASGVPEDVRSRG